MTVKRAVAIPLACALAVLAAEVLALALMPAGWRPAGSFLLAAGVAAALVAVVMRAEHQRTHAAAGTSSACSFPSGDGCGGDAASPQIRLACQLARRGVPADRIARRCNLPFALAELIVSAAGQTPVPPPN